MLRTRTPGIYKKDSGRYCVKIYVSKNRQLTQTFNDLEPAKAWQAKMATEVRAGFQPEPQLTVWAYFNRWLGNRRPSMAPSSAALYRVMLDDHILPALGQTRLSKLAPGQLETLYREKLEAGLSPSTVHLLHAIIGAGLRAAMKQGLVARNVAALVDKPPRKSDFQGQAWDLEQSRLFWGQAHRSAPLTMYALFALGMTSGARLGELLALRWSDLNLTYGEMAITKKVARFSKRMREATGVMTLFVVAQPKSSRGVRTVPLVAPVIDVLKRLQAEQNQAKDTLGSKYVDLDLVFAGPTGNFLNPATVRHEFKRICELCKLPAVRLQDATRHSVGSNLLALGVDPATVARILGHTPQMLMSRYAHQLPGGQEAAIGRLETALFATKEEKHGNPA